MQTESEEISLNILQCQNGNLCAEAKFQISSRCYICEKTDQGYKPWCNDSKKTYNQWVEWGFNVIKLDEQTALKLCGHDIRPLIDEEINLFAAVAKYAQEKTEIFYEDTISFKETYGSNDVPPSKILGC